MELQDFIVWVFLGSIILIPTIRIIRRKQYIKKSNVLSEKIIESKNLLNNELLNNLKKEIDTITHSNEYIVLFYKYLNDRIFEALNLQQVHSKDPIIILNKNRANKSHNLYLFNKLSEELKIYFKILSDELNADILVIFKSFLDNLDKYESLNEFNNKLA